MDHLQLVVQAGAIVKDEDAVILRIRVEVRHNALLERHHELIRVVAALDDVAIDHAEETEHAQCREAHPAVKEDGTPRALALRRAAVATVCGALIGVSA